MSAPSSTELAALDEAGALLRFAAEKVKDLDPELSLHIAEAREAGATNQWTPQVSANFWNSFAKLCDLIKPVTMDCISMSIPTINHRSFLTPWHARRITIAERSSGRYYATLFILLFIVLPLQLYIWACADLIKKIDDYTSDINNIISKNQDNFTKLDVEMRASTTYSPDQITRSLVFENLAPSIRPQLQKISAETDLLSRITMLNLIKSDSIDLSAAATGTDWYKDYTKQVINFNYMQTSLVDLETRINLEIGIFTSFILPTLFSAIGALAYVIRTISEQIRDTTFSATSPIRHLMRVALGVLTGVVVGLFNGLSAQLSVSPLAVAFLAGYGVEAVFSMFDSIIANFRQLRTQS